VVPACAPCLVLPRQLTLRKFPKVIDLSKLPEHLKKDKPFKVTADPSKLHWTPRIDVKDRGRGAF